MNGLPFQARPGDDVGSFSDPGTSTARRAWPTTVGWPTSARRRRGRRAGQALISFDDVELAVDDIHGAQEHGLGGGHDARPPAQRDPLLRPSASTRCGPRASIVGLPVSQHGGTGAPAFGPFRRVRRHHDPGSRALLLLGPLPVADDPGQVRRSSASPHCGSPSSRRRRRTGSSPSHPQARPPTRLGRRLEPAGAQTLQRMRQFTGSARDYWSANCMAGISPFTEQLWSLSTHSARPSAGVRGLRHRV